MLHSQLRRAASGQQRLAVCRRPRRHAANVAASQGHSTPEQQQGSRRSAAASSTMRLNAAPNAAVLEPTPVRATSGGAAPKQLFATLLVQCPDAKGVVASLAQLLYGFSCNIVESDQFTDTDDATFFQRIRFDYTDCQVGAGNMPVVERAVAELAQRYSMEWEILYERQTTRVAILVSKMDHCLYDLLIRHRSGELDCHIPVIMSNHPDLEHVAKQFGVEYITLPATASKADREAHIERTLEEHGINLLILARYMQIFSQEFCQRHWRHTINIHHSFLPAFEGAKPYHRAHERGVKIIGATAHYATAELDAGPIIEQDITRITHRDSVADMIRKGRDLERLVLSRAIRWHLEARVLVHGNKTVVFQD